MTSLAQACAEVTGIDTTLVRACLTAATTGTEACVRAWVELDEDTCWAVAGATARFDVVGPIDETTTAIECWVPLAGVRHLQSI